MNSAFSSICSASKSHSVNPLLAGNSTREMIEYTEAKKHRHILVVEVSGAAINIHLPLLSSAVIRAVIVLFYLYCPVT